MIHSPKVTRRPVLTWSSTEDDRTIHVPATALLIKSKGDSVDRDEVFQKIEEASTSHHPARPNTPLNSSPRVSSDGLKNPHIFKHFRLGKIAQKKEDTQARILSGIVCTL